MCDALNPFNANAVILWVQNSLSGKAVGAILDIIIVDVAVMNKRDCNVLLCNSDYIQINNKFFLPCL